MSLTAADICAIIKTCGEAGVVRLRFQDLRLSFDKPSKDTRPPAPEPFWVGPGPTELPLTVATMTAPEHDQIQNDGLVSDELAVREQQIEDLLITDPAKAEELIAQGELTPDERQDGSEDDE